MWDTVAHCAPHLVKNMKQATLLLLAGLLVLGATADVAAECVPVEGAEVCAEAGEDGASVSVTYGDEDDNAIDVGIDVGA